MVKSGPEMSLISSSVPQAFVIVFHFGCDLHSSKLVTVEAMEKKREINMWCHFYVIW